MANSERFLQTLAMHVAAGKTVRDSAVLIECSESTAYRLASSDEFKAEVTRLKTEAVSQAVAVLSSSAVKAAETLVTMLGEGFEPKDRLAAARLILANLQPIAEHGELRARIDRIEQQQFPRVAQ